MFQILMFADKSRDSCFAQIQKTIFSLEKLNEAEFVSFIRTHRRQIQPNEFRFAVAVRNLTEAMSILSSVAPGDIQQTEHIDLTSIAFWFGPQGPQYVNMGKKMYGVAPEYTKTIDRLFAYSAKYNVRDLRELLYPTVTTVTDEDLQSGDVSSTVMLLIQRAISEQLTAWGIRAGICASWSSGDLGSALYAKAIDEEEAVRFYSQRSKIMAKAPKADLIVVTQKYRIPEDLYVQGEFSDDFRAYLGPKESIEKFVKELSENDVPYITRQTPYGFHSPMMKCIEGDYFRLLSTFSFRKCSPETTVITTLKADVVDRFKPEYWMEQMMNTLYIGQTLRKLDGEMGIKVIVPIGPLPILQRLMDVSGCKRMKIIKTCGDRKDNRDSTNLYSTVCELWMRGFPVDWNLMYSQ